MTYRAVLKQDDNIAFPVKDIVPVPYAFWTGVRIADEASIDVVEGMLLRASHDYQVRPEKGHREREYFLPPAFEVYVDLALAL